MKPLRTAVLGCGRFASGGRATISATNGTIPNRRDYDWGGLTADFSDANHAIFHHTTEKDLPQTIIRAEDDLYLAETLDLLAAIREDRDPAVPIEEGFLSLNLALATTRAAEEDPPVSLESPVEVPHSQEIE
jgi:predicted dehydrogenase